MADLLDWLPHNGVFGRSESCSPRRVQDTRQLLSDRNRHSTPLHERLDHRASRKSIEKGARFYPRPFRQQFFDMFVTEGMVEDHFGKWAGI